MPKYKHPVQLRMNGKGITTTDMVGILENEYGMKTSTSYLTQIFSGKLRSDLAMQTLDRIRKYLDGLENRKEE